MPTAFNYKTLVNPVVAGYTESVVTANTGTQYTIVLNGTVQILTLTGSCTYTFPAPIAGKSFLLVQKQTSVSFAVTWPASVKWPLSTAPTISVSPGRVDLFAFTSDGTYWYGRFIGNTY